MLTLLRSMGRREEVVWLFAAALMRAFKCLIAYFAWGKTFLAALRDYNQSEASADETMTFLSSVRVLDKDLCPAGAFDCNETVSCPGSTERSTNLPNGQQIFADVQDADLSIF